MDVTSTLKTPASVAANPDDIAVNPKSVLGKDDFLKLLLVELQYQDPTDPMDSDKILTQTSELASLEAADNTNKALEELTATLSQTSSMSAISAIGKMGSLGHDSVLLPEEGSADFELYFPQSASSGTVTVRDVEGNVVRSFDFDALPEGINAFSWDGTDDNGARVPAGSYRIKADYVTSTGEKRETAYGYYPIESVRFDGGKAYVKMGSHYYPLESVAEIYEG